MTDPTKTNLKVFFFQVGFGTPIFVGCLFIFRHVAERYIHTEGVVLSSLLIGGISGVSTAVVCCVLAFFTHRFLGYNLMNDSEEL